MQLPDIKFNGWETTCDDPAMKLSNFFNLVSCHLGKAQGYAGMGIKLSSMDMDNLERELRGIEYQLINLGQSIVEIDGYNYDFSNVKYRLSYYMFPPEKRLRLRNKGFKKTFNLFLRLRFFLLGVRNPKKKTLSIEKIK